MFMYLGRWTFSGLDVAPAELTGDVDPSPSLSRSTGEPCGDLTSLSRSPFALCEGLEEVLTPVGLHKQMCSSG